MATNIPLISEEREDNYELELSRVREKINTSLRNRLTFWAEFWSFG